MLLSWNRYCLQNIIKVMEPWQEILPLGLPFNKTKYGGISRHHKYVHVLDFPANGPLMEPLSTATSSSNKRCLMLQTLYVKVDKNKYLFVELVRAKILLYFAPFSMTDGTENTPIEVAHSNKVHKYFTGGELSNGVNGFLTSYATDSVRFSQ